MVIFEPSNTHQGHYIVIDNESTGMVINLYFYKINADYKKEIDEKIKEYTTKKK